jgi:lipopolysaccharide transport system ATP-binding protein
MSDIILKAENISKQYRLGLVGTGTLSHDLNRLWAKIRGKEDPYLKVGAVNDRSAAASSDYVWALQGINFEVKRGEILGIIGKNGAGKSTLLKILSRVTSPTTGSIKTSGRIASLLEVGTGMHPELTGRENIFLNGAILGMNKTEVSNKIDEIIEFSGCQMYIDTPVKRYSSGMRVRLGFAVAAFLEPDILVVDEVLAVGDAEFQKKAIGKMQDISNIAGRTVLFVSHNMAAVQNLCSRSIVLEKGYITYDGDTQTAINQYLSLSKKTDPNSKLEAFIKSQHDEHLRLTSVIFSNNAENSFHFYAHKPLTITFSYEVLQNVFGLRMGFDLIDLKTGNFVFRSFHDDGHDEISATKKGHLQLQTTIPENLLNDGTYRLRPIAGIHNNKWIVYEEALFIEFTVNNLGGLNRSYMEKRPGIIMPAIEWCVN